jgi:hypothetical protein
VNKKWVDNEVYFGPDRRQRDGSKRWGDQRKVNDAGDPPPLGSLLRRLQIALIDINDPVRRQRVQQMISLGIMEAQRQRNAAAADRLHQLSRLIMLKAPMSNLESMLMEAQAAAQTTGGFR